MFSFVPSFSKIDANCSEPFIERLESMQFNGDGDPAKTLFVWLNKQKEQGKRRAFVAPLIYYKKCLAAIHAHATTKECVKIYQKKGHIPQGKPCGLD